MKLLVKVKLTILASILMGLTPQSQSQNFDNCGDYDYLYDEIPDNKPAAVGRPHRYKYNTNIFDSEQYDIARDIEAQGEVDDDLNAEPIEFVVNGRFPHFVLPIDRTGRFDLLNPEVGPEGQRFLQGDMAMDDPEEELLRLENLGRNFVSHKHLWPVDSSTGWPTVPFIISSSVNKSRDVILAAMALWENSTCISFSELTGPVNTTYINFVRWAGCWSYVGRQYKKNGPQNLSIGRGCKRVGTIAHEIGHALGMLHEQSRSDRDDYVTVLWDNITPLKRKNFKKSSDDTADVPYDTSSIMHYGGFYFSKGGNLTLLTRNPYHQWHLGQRVRPTFRDILTANTMYGCVARWSEGCKNVSIWCENGGYLNKNCTCLCPPGTKGDVCHLKSGDYYPKLPCGGNVTSSQNISSPNFPNPFPTDSWCMWWAQAGKCQKVKLTFHEFDLLYRDSGRCFWDTLEIRYEDPFLPGQVFCGCEIEKGQHFYSKEESLFLAFHGKYEYAKGFSATVDFIEDPHCSLLNEVIV